MRQLSVADSVTCITCSMLVSLLQAMLLLITLAIPGRAFSQETPMPECITFNINPQDVADKKASRIDASHFLPLEGKTIRHISLHQLNIFNENDPDENNRAYMLLNKLHFKTRTKVVKSQLFFKEGDKVKAKTIEESARNLRQRKYFTNAYIVPEQVCGDYVDVVVVTQDAWSLEPQFSYSHKSSSNQTGFAINDGNILGTGNAFTIGYSSNQLRNTVSYEFSNPYAFNKQIALDLLYQDTSDGRNMLVSVAHPFYSLDTPWATGVQVSDLSLAEEVLSHGKVVNEFRHRAIDNEVYIGKATEINARYTQRWLVGFTQEQDRFYTLDSTLQPIPANDKLAYPWIEYQFLQNKYGVFKNLNQIQRPEDIAMGQTLSLRLGMAGTAFGNPDDVVRYKASYQNIRDLSEKHILELHMQLDGHEHIAINNLDPYLFTSSLAYHYLEDEKNRWYASIEYDVGENLPQYKELTVGDITGLRGYPTDYLRGDKRYVVTLERRYFSDVHIFNLMRMGTVVFMDAGQAWGLPNESRSPLLSDIGIGLRFSSTKIRIGNVIHIDIAVPTSARADISKYQLTIGAQQKF